MSTLLRSRQFILLLVMKMLVVTACEIEEIVYDENPFVVKKNHLSFTGFELSNKSIHHHDSVTLTAKATGDSLVFNWSASAGFIAAKGQDAIFYPDTTGFFAVSCTVTDKYDNSHTETAEIAVVMELVFSGITASDTLLPPGITSVLTAFASGEEIDYTWTSSAGQITFNGNKAEFNSDITGNFLVTCQIRDKYDVVLEESIELEVTDGLIFQKLEATKTTIEPYEIAWITAHAYGEDLTYQWNAEPMGVLIGYGDMVRFSNCCANVHVISCKVSDKKGNSQTRQITITITD